MEDCDNCLMGHVGNVRDANVVRLLRGVIDEYDIYKKLIDYRFVVKRLFPAIVSTLKEANYIKQNEDYVGFLESSFMFAYKDKLFLINSDGAVLEIDDFAVLGSGSQEAVGSLLSTEGQDPKIRIIKAIKASAANDIYVDYPIILSDTETTKFEVVTETNEAKFIGKDTKAPKPH